MKVFFPVGGGANIYFIASADNTHSVVTYLSNNFLGGQSDSRPPGDVVLDGIDFNFEATMERYDNLVK
ncbi:hypothetical protein KI387_033749, partial [Taxus chinensis]